MYHKVKEPKEYSEKMKKKAKNSGESSKGKAAPGCQNITEFLDRKSKKENSSSIKRTQNKHKTLTGASTSATSFVGEGHKLCDGVASVKPTSLTERRQKLLEAVEKRQGSGQQNGLKRKASQKCQDIRLFTTSSKRPKTSSDCFIVEDNDHSPASNPSQQSSSPGGSGGSPVADLTRDSYTSEDCAVPCHAEDGSYCGPVRMCPVCGRTDIPLAIINLHVAYCLDEEYTCS